MSYDVSLTMYSGKEHTRVGDLDANYTWNIYPMVKAAASIVGVECFSNEWDGLDCLSAAARLERIITELEKYPEKYKSLNPTNGWGNYEGCVEFLKKILCACMDHPLAQLRVA